VAKGKYEQWLTEDGLLLLRAWARDGLTDEQIAKKCEVVPSTLYEWKKRHSEISEALKKGKEPVDIAVENALLKRALGYDYVETTQELRRDTESGEMRLVVTKIVTKMVVPDTIAQFYWLKNRRPDKWQDKPSDRTAEHEDDGLFEAITEAVKG